MNLIDLNKEYDKLQVIYGDKNLYSVSNGGCEVNPKFFLVFMNPTGKNIASLKNWQGKRSPWIGTKNIWKLFYSLDLINKITFDNIQKIKGCEWNEEFATEVYNDITNHKVFITNLGKCTQIDARPLPNSVYKEYLELLYREVDIVKPKIIFTFGNQVSSIFLNKAINVSKCRKQYYNIIIHNNEYKVYPIYYPIGNGMRNINMAIDDMKYVINEEMSD